MLHSPSSSRFSFTKKVFGCIFRQRYLIIHLASLVFFPSNPTGRSVQLKFYCMCQRERCMKLNSSNGSDTSRLYFLRIYWSWLYCNWRFLRYTLVCMHNIDEKGRRKDVLLTTAVSEKLMRKGLHTYLLDEIYENSRSVKVKVKINWVHFCARIQTIWDTESFNEKNCWFLQFVVIFPTWT